MPPCAMASPPLPRTPRPPRHTRLWLHGGRFGHGPFSDIRRLVRYRSAGSASSSASSNRQRIHRLDHPQAAPRLPSCRTSPFTSPRAPAASRQGRHSRDKAGEVAHRHAQVCEASRPRPRMRKLRGAGRRAVMPCRDLKVLQLPRRPQRRRKDGLPVPRHPHAPAAAPSTQAASGRPNRRAVQQRFSMTPCVPQDGKRKSPGAEWPRTRQPGMHATTRVTTTPCTVLNACIMAQTTCRVRGQPRPGMPVQRRYRSLEAAARGTHMLARGCRGCTRVAVSVATIFPQPRIWHSEPQNSANQRIPCDVDGFDRAAGVDATLAATASMAETRKDHRGVSVPLVFCSCHFPCTCVLVRAAPVAMQSYRSAEL